MSDGLKYPRDVPSVRTQLEKPSVYRIFDRRRLCCIANFVLFELEELVVPAKMFIVIRRVNSKVRTTTAARDSKDR